MRDGALLRILMVSFHPVLSRFSFTAIRPVVVVADVAIVGDFAVVCYSFCTLFTFCR